MTSLQVAGAINVLGFSAGAVLYATLLLMASREYGGYTGDAQVAPTFRHRLLQGTAVAGFTWNLGALAIYSLLDAGRTPPPLMEAAAFSALGLLPAAVVHAVVFQVSLPRYRRAVAASGYLISATAAALQLRAALTGASLPDPAALRLLTAGFVLLVPFLLVVSRGQPGARRAGWIAALALFAVSAIHLAAHRPQDPWALEVVGHHASLPLVLALLYQDYPFALADIFLKRALSVFGLGLLVLGAWAAVTVLAPEPQTTPVVLLGAWVVTALAFPWMQRAATRIVDTVVLHRLDYTVLHASTVRELGTLDDESAILAAACVIVARALHAQQVEWRRAEAPTPHHPEPPRVLTIGPRRIAATLVIPTAEAPFYGISIDSISGGRRLLSDDGAMLQQLALTVARRLDAVRLNRERFASRLREEEAQRHAVEAQLDTLRAQIHPHFLFNALSAIAFLVHDAPSRAVDTILKLTDVLRRVLRADPRLTTLGEEVALLDVYLKVEQVRFEERLNVHIDVPHALASALVPPLVLQPLVENAVKHGIAPLGRGGTIRVRAREVERLDGRADLELVVVDTGRGPRTGPTGSAGLGIGLSNLERRLTLMCGAETSVTLRRIGPETVARVVLPLTRPDEPKAVPTCETGC